MKAYKKKIHSGQISFISHRTVNVTYIHHINILSCNNKEFFGKIMLSLIKLLMKTTVKWTDIDRIKAMYKHGMASIVLFFFHRL